MQNTVCPKHIFILNVELRRTMYILLTDIKFYEKKSDDLRIELIERK